MCLIHNNMFCEKCGAEVNDNEKFCSTCGASLSTSNDAKKSKIKTNKIPTEIITKNKKIIVGLIGIFVIILIIGLFLYMEENQAKIIIPEEYTLESNESGVETYVNNLDNGYKLEIKEEGNQNGIAKEDRYGTEMKCTVGDKNYSLTCYNPVDKNRTVAIEDRYSDIKVHPGVKTVEAYHAFEPMPNGVMKFSKDLPYDMKVLKQMNETGHLNCYYYKQTFPTEYQNAVDTINKADAVDTLQRHGWI